MSCCGENGGSGSGREGSSGSGGCKTYPDLAEKTTTETVVLGVGPAEKARFFDGAEVAAAAAENGCKCGSNCTCDPCTCK